MKLPAPVTPFEVMGYRFVDSRLLSPTDELAMRRLLARGLFTLPPVLYCEGSWDPVREIEAIVRSRGLERAAAIAAWKAIAARRESIAVWAGELEPISFGIRGAGVEFVAAFQLWAMAVGHQSTERDTVVEARYFPAGPDLPIGEAMLLFLETIFALIDTPLAREDGGTLTISEWKAKHWWALNDGDWFFEPFEAGIRARVDAASNLSLTLIPEAGFPERVTWWIRRRGAPATPQGNS